MKNSYQLNSREDILAEINMLKVLVWKLWEDRFDDIDNKEWNKMKKEVIKKMKKSEKGKWDSEISDK